MYNIFVIQAQFQLPFGIHLLSSCIENNVDLRGDLMSMY